MAHKKLKNFVRHLSHAGLGAVLCAFLVLNPYVEASNTRVSVQSSAYESFDGSKELNAALKQSALLKEMKEKLAEAQFRHLLYMSNLDNAKGNLEEVRETVEHLEALVDDLNEEINEKRRQFLNVKAQREKRAMEIEKLDEELEELEVDLELQKETVSEMMLLLYVNRDRFYDEGQVNAVKLLASPDSISKTLQDVTYLDIIENTQSEQLNSLAQSIELSEERKLEIQEKRTQLLKLDETLTAELEALILERDAQADLLEETQKEERILQAMLAASSSREEDLISEVELYQKSIRSLQQKLAELSDLLPAEQKALVKQIEAEAQLEFENAEAIAGLLKLSWPVSPKAGLTAFFDDSGYKSRFGVAHGALDIRQAQASPISAAADGVVTDVVYDEESTAYAYILLSHVKGVMTLYGHVSAVNVEVGDFVKRGDVVGLTGGAVGGIGTGYRSTGPHLHMEVFQDGARVDPLKYLPLEEVPQDSLPEQYAEQLKEELDAKLKEVQDTLGVEVQFAEQE